MRVLISLLLLTLSVSAFASEKDFWNWFVKNQTEIEAYKTGDEKLLNNILAALHKYNDKLFYLFSVKGKVNEFIITAEGDSEQFDSVYRLVNAAPKLKNWKIIALKPAQGFDFVTSYEGVDYDPGKIWFLPLQSKKNPQLLGLRVGIPGFDKKIHEHSVNAVWLLLDSGLGEFKTTQEVKHVEIIALPEKPADKGYIEMNKIGAYLKWRKKKLLNKK